MYKKLSREVTALIRKEKILYYSKKIKTAGNNRKKYWSIIKSILNEQKEEVQEIIIDNKKLNTLEHAGTVPNAFNNFFCKYSKQACRN